MSSPHIGGDFLHQLALKGNRSGSGGSGRNTPVRPGSPAHRSTPGQIAYGRPQPIRSSHSIGDGDDSDDDDDPNHGVVQAGSWRPITPARGISSSPRPLSGSFIPDAIAARIFPGSSRNRNLNDHGSPHPDDMQLQMQHSHMQVDPGRPGDDTLIATEDMVADGEEMYEQRVVKFSELHPVLKGYLLGQIACVIKFGSDARTQGQAHGRRGHRRERSCCLDHHCRRCRGREQSTVALAHAGGNSLALLSFLVCGGSA
jgi:hypothetical protein